MKNRFLKFALVLAAAFAPLFSMAGEAGPVFKVEPLSVSFPLMRAGGGFDKSRMRQKTLFGNFPKQECVLGPKSSADAHESPLFIMREILCMFNAGKKHEGILSLVSPNISKEGKDFYLSWIKHPKFAEAASRTSSFRIMGYFLFGENKCAVLYKTNDKERESLCFRYIFVFENGQWYLGDQLEEAESLVGELSSFYDFYGNDSDKIGIKAPNREEALSLAKDAAAGLYEKLAAKYGWESFSKYIESLGK